MESSFIFIQWSTKRIHLRNRESVKLPFGFGEISINKKKEKDIKGNNEFINLPIDWKRLKEKGKLIYNFNYDTEGYFFGIGLKNSKI
jgi:hypothetical protein